MKNDYLADKLTLLVQEIKELENFVHSADAQRMNWTDKVWPVLRSLNN